MSNDMPELTEENWDMACIEMWGRVLTGKQAHWCPDWDYMPIDETTSEELKCCGCEPN